MYSILQLFLEKRTGLTVDLLYQLVFYPLKVVGHALGVTYIIYFVFATTAAKVCGSRMAISDNILRLSSMLAFLRAETSLL